MNIGPIDLIGQNIFLNLPTDHGKCLIFNIFQLWRRLFSKDLEVPVYCSDINVVKAYGGPGLSSK